MVDGRWEFSGYHVIRLGEPHVSVRCLCVVGQRVWCAYRNQVFVILPETLATEVTTLSCLSCHVSVCVIINSDSNASVPKTAQNQNGPQIFPMSRMAHMKVQNGPTQVQNGPQP